LQSVSRQEETQVYKFLTCKGKPRTTDLPACATADRRPWLWGAALRRGPEHSPRTIVVGGEVDIVRGSSPRLPRSDKQEEPKCIFGPSVLTPTSYASCSIRIGAYAGGVLWYGVNLPSTYPHHHCHVASHGTMHLDNVFVACEPCTEGIPKPISYQYFNSLALKRPGHSLF